MSQVKFRVFLAEQEGPGSISASCNFYFAPQVKGGCGKIGTSRSEIVWRKHTQILVKIILAMLPVQVKSGLNKHRLGQKVPLRDSAKSEWY